MFSLYSACMIYNYPDISRNRRSKVRNPPVPLIYWRDHAPSGYAFIQKALAGEGGKIDICLCMTGHSYRIFQMKLKMLMLLIVLLFVAQANAFKKADQKHHWGSNSTISAKQAAKVVKHQFNGKKLKVKKKQKKGQATYKVKLIKDNGHIISVHVDARSGQIQ